MIFSNLISNCSNVLDLRNLQEQVKKAFCYQKLFWPFTVWINCSSDLKNFANSRPSALNFKSFPWSLEQFFLTEGQNDFGNKMPFQKCYHFRMEEFKFREKSMKSFMDSPFQLLYSLGTLISAAPHFLTRKRKKA